MSSHGSHGYVVPRPGATRRMFREVVDDEISRARSSGCLEGVRGDAANPAATACRASADVGGHCAARVRLVRELLSQRAPRVHVPRAAQAGVAGAAVVRAVAAACARRSAGEPGVGRRRFVGRPGVCLRSLLRAARGAAPDRAMTMSAAQEALGGLERTEVK